MRAIARFGAFAALTLILGGAAHAQAQDQSAAPAADAVSPRRLELANELIEASGGKAQLQNIFRGMTSQLAATVGDKLSADQKTQMQLMVNAEGDALAKRFPELQRAMVTSYAETYSEQELSDALAFYKSASGQAMITKAPRAIQGVMVTIFKMMPEVQRDAGEEVCAKITCTAAQKAAFMGETPPKP